MKQERKEDIHTLQSKFFILLQSTFLNYNIFYKLPSNKEILVVLWLLLYKLCKINNGTWLELSLLKNFQIEACKVFRGHNVSPRISNFWLMYHESSWGEVILLVAVILLLIFSVFWRTIIITFFHCLFVDGEKLCQKPKIQYDDKEIQHGLQLINNGASTEVELGLSIVEIYVDQNSKS